MEEAGVKLRVSLSCLCTDLTSVCWFARCEESSGRGKSQEAKRLTLRQLPMTDSFSASELKLALSEIPWGLRSSTLLPVESSSEAKAQVELLEEGQFAVLCCRGNGWTVAGAQGGCMKVRPARRFADWRAHPPFSPDYRCFRHPRRPPTGDLAAIRGEADGEAL